MFNRLHEKLNYDPETGVWTWRITSRAAIKGKRAGSIHASKGDVRRHIGFEGKYYLSSRLAWFYMTGIWPTLVIDHIDGSTLNDKWDNLREVTQAQNCLNRRYTRRISYGRSRTHR